MNKRLLKLYTGVLAFILILLGSMAQGQALQIGDTWTRFEVGINVGPSFFLGDLGGNRGLGQRFIKDVNLSLTNVMKGAYVTVYPTKWLGVRAVAQFGKLEAEDDIIKNYGGDELYRKQRNLDFRTNIFEAYVAAEVYPLSFLYANDDYDPRWLPYLILGVGIYSYNPQGSLTDANGNKTWYYLKPLHLEGQGFDEYPDRKEYSLNQINIPMGVGIKYLISPRINMSLEILLRKSFNDYVDDVSTTYIDPALFDKYLSGQDAKIAKKIFDKMNSIVDPSLSRYAPGMKRGNPYQNDSWFTTFLKIGIRLGPVSGHERAMKRMRCPKRW